MSEGVREQRAGDEAELHRLRTLYQLLANLTKADTLEEVCEAAITSILSATEADRAAILFFDDDGVMRPKAWRGLSAEYRQAVAGRTPWQPGTRHAEPILVSDVSLDESLTADQDVFARERIRALTFIPLASNAGVLGKFMLYYAQPHDTTSDELARAQAIANHVALAAQRKRAESALRTSEERYRAFVQHSSEGIWRFEMEQPIPADLPAGEQIARAYETAYLAECNDVTARMYGFESASEMIGVRLADFVPSSDPHNQAYLRAFVESGYRLTGAESHEQDRHGNPKIFLNSLVGIVEDGKLVRAWGTQQDVTESKVVERQLRAVSEQLQFHLENTPLAAIEFAPDNRIIRWSKQAEHLFGWKAEEMLGRRISDVRWVHEDDQPGVSRVLAEMTAGQLQNIHRNRNYTKDGSIRHCEWYNSARRDEHGGLESIFSLAHDVTERNQAEEAVRLSEERLRLAADAGKVGLWDWDIRANRIIWSDTVYKMHGLTEDAFGGTVDDFQKLIHPDDAPQVSAALRDTLEKGTPYELEFRTIRPNGEVRWLAANARVIYNEDHSPVRMVGAVLDITDRIETELALRRSNAKLEEFAYVASHDLQEPLRTIAIYTQMLLRHYGSMDSQAEQYAHFIRTGVQRIETLIQDLLSYSRAIHSHAEGLQRVDLNAALGQALQILQSRTEEAAAQVRSDDLPAVSGDQSQFSIVFQNLISNALKYRKKEEPCRIDITASRTDAGTTVVCVGDNGIGFDPKYSERIFGLFKRLHNELYPGTGLGLAICRRIIEGYGGHIWAESEPGVGSKFYFTVHTPHLSG